MTNDQTTPNEIEQSMIRPADETPLAAEPTVDPAAVETTAPVPPVEPVTAPEAVSTPATEVEAAPEVTATTPETPAAPEATPDVAPGIASDAAVTVVAAEAVPAEKTDAEATAPVEGEAGEKSGGEKKSRRKSKLSEEEAAEIWKELVAAKEGEALVTVRCIRAIPGGALVDYKGLEGFVPRSQFQLSGRAEQADIEPYIGQEIEIVVVEISELERRKFVCSRRKAMKKAKFGQFHKGDVIEGVVTSITNYGVFVDLGGVDGLIHISRLSKTHVKTPSEVVQLQETVKVKVVSVDVKAERIALSMKEFTESPWSKIGDQFAVGTLHKGKVKNLTSFGVYVQLEPGIVGMVHISDLSWTRRIQNPAEIVTVGQDIDVKVIDSKPQEKRIALSVKDTLPNPWPRLANIYPAGAEADGVLKQVMDAGAIVSLDFDIDCFVPRGKMGIRKPRKGQPQVESTLKVGDPVRVKVVEMDPERRSFICALVREDSEEKHYDDKPSSFTVTQTASDRAFTMADLPGMQALLNGADAPVAAPPAPAPEAAPAPVETPVADAVAADVTPVVPEPEASSEPAAEAAPEAAASPAETEGAEPAENDAV